MVLAQNVQVIYWVRGVFKGHELACVYYIYGGVCLCQLVGLAMKWMGCGGGFYILVYIIIYITWGVLELTM